MMRTPDPSQPRIPDGTTGGQGVRTKGAALRELVNSALQQRERADRHAWSRKKPATTRLSVMRLQEWLRVNPCPSDATVRQFPLVRDLEVVALGNAAGAKLKNDLQTLLRGA